MRKPNNNHENIPAEVIFVMASQFVGHDLFVRTVKKYPEYFPKEYKAITRYESIPQEAHDAFTKELFDMTNELYKDEPKIDGGIIWCMEHPEEMKKWRDFRDSKKDEYDKMYKKLHKKHYGNQ